MWQSILSHDPSVPPNPSRHLDTGFARGDALNEKCQRRGNLETLSPTVAHNVAQGECGGFAGEGKGLVRKLFDGSRQGHALPLPSAWGVPPGSLSVQPSLLFQGSA